MTYIAMYCMIGNLLSSSCHDAGVVISLSIGLRCLFLINGKLMWLANKVFQQMSRIPTCGFGDHFVRSNGVAPILVKRTGALLLYMRTFSLAR